MKKTKKPQHPQAHNIIGAPEYQLLNRKYYVNIAIQYWNVSECNEPDSNQKKQLEYFTQELNLINKELNKINKSKKPDPKGIQLQNWIGKRFEFEAYDNLLTGSIALTSQNVPVLMFDNGKTCGCLLRAMYDQISCSNGKTLSLNGDLCTRCGSLRNFKIIDPESKEILFIHSN